MTAILGVSAFYHDSAAALVVDGQVVAAAAEERFTRQKHDASFPSQAIKFCLDKAAIAPDQIDFVGFHEKPLLKFDRLLETYLAFAPSGYRSFRTAMPSWLTTKLRIPRVVRRQFEGAYRKRIVYCSHHESHAASAFFPSPFDEAAIVTIDGVGEWLTATIGTGHGNRIEIDKQLRFPHSLGLLYSAFTSFCGFGVNEGEYKLMGLAAYGEPVYRDLITERIIDLKADGSFRLDMAYFNYCQGLTMTSPKLEMLLGFRARLPSGEIRQQYKDLAASIQAVAEEVLLRIVRHVHATTNLKNLVMAGGVALNCVANGRIKREGPFDDVWIQPAAGDDGGALGVSLFIWHQLLGNQRPIEPDRRRSDSQCGSLLGPSYSEDEVLTMLRHQQVGFRAATDDQELCELTARLLADKKVVGWFQGAMEFGPRALGSRSILADPRDPSMHVRLNATVKDRESFRPFAPAALVEQAHEHYQIDNGEQLPYMLFAVPCSSPALLPAVTHVDHSARLQSVDPNSNPLFHQLLSKFARLTNCPVLVNTSFNMRGEPIVCSPIDAYRCFLKTDIDVLVIGRHILQKSDDSMPVKNGSVAESPSLRPNWLNLEVPWNPTDQMLKQFALSVLITLPLMGMILRFDWAPIAIMLAGGILMAVASTTSPRLVRLVYRALLMAVLPLVMVFSEAILALIFFLVITPLGRSLRLFGYHGLALKFDPATTSYWQETVSSTAAGQYYRQS